ncbi:glycosyltransferase family 39 protein [bacterium]|nr:glycosyltransferase family 39 protein [bacterium]
MGAFESTRPYPRQPWTVRSIIAVGCLLSAFLANFFVLGFKPMSIQNIDETAWIYGSYYYYLAFQKKDLFSDDWQVRDAIDHPPVGKFFVGAALSLVGYEVPSVDFKHRWYERTDLNEHEVLVEEAKQLPPLVLPAGRLMSTLCFALSGLIAASLSHRVFGSPWAGVCSLAVMLLSPLIRELSVNVMAEGPFYLLLSLTVWLSVSVVERWRQNRPVLSALVLLGVVAGLLTDTKINGFTSVPLSAASLVLGAMLLTPTAETFLKRSLVATMIVAIISTTTIIYANPSLWREPIAYLNNVWNYRLLNLEGQLIFVYWEAFPTLGIKISAVLAAVFREHDPFFPICVLPLGLFVGLLLLGSKDSNRTAGIVLLIHTMGWFASNFLTFQINGPRYFLATSFFVFVIAGGGFLEILLGLKSIAPSIRQKLLLSVVSIWLMAGIPYFIYHNNTRRYLDSHPEAVRQAIERKEKLIHDSSDSNDETYERTIPSSNSRNPENATVP